MKSTLHFCFTVCFVCVFASCSNVEKSIDIPERREPTEMSKGPGWTLTPPPPNNGFVHFVGRSGAVNILDERQGINEATNDAIYQIARMAGATVSASAKILESRSSSGAYESEVRTSESNDDVQIDIQSIVSGVRQVDAYRELWQVQDPKTGKSLRRYKYWVLFTFPESELQRLQGELKKK